jgi:hypothetical protein
MNVYLANLSFDLDTNAGPFTEGHCVAIVEAPDPEAALDKFRALMSEAKAREGLFELVKRVYLDSCTEMVAVPREGLITFMELRDPRGGSIEAANVGSAQRLAVTAFGFGDPDADVEQPIIEFD